MSNNNIKFSTEIDSILKEKLRSTNYSVKEVIELFVENCKEFAENLDEIKHVSSDEIGEGKGFCSRIFKIEMEFTDKTSKNDKFAFIVKASSGEQWDELTSEETKLNPKHSQKLIMQMHNGECAAYELLAKLKNIPTPTMYYSKRADDKTMGIILMEDVGEKGKSLEVHESSTIEQCEDVIRLIADFQSQLNFLEDQSWRENFKINYQATEIVDKVVKGMMGPALDFKDKEITDQVQKYVDIDLKILAKFAIEEFTHQKDGAISTLCHTDMWSNNLLMKVNPDGSFSNKISSIIDWQTACLGNPLYDVCCFILFCASTDIRQEWDQRFVDFYYDELTKHYAKKNEKPKFTREEAHEFYRIAFVQMIVSLIMTCAIHALPLENSEKPEEQEKYEHLVRRLRVAFKDARPTWEKYDLLNRCTPKK